ncbi:MAG: OmpA family protein, partial [Bacteroidales bacterium]|nr:OmpA family protein [Bacteroidales bacterium]
VYTVRRQSDGSWDELAEFQFNHYENGPDFVGRVGQPAISPNGNRLLFVVKDEEGGTGTDIWYMERIPETPPAKVTRKKKVASPSAAARSRSAASKARAPKQPVNPLGALVQVNKDWGGPIRLDSLVNTKGLEQFPQWLNDTCFVFASDGMVGMGGLDLDIADLDQMRRIVSKVKHIPAPINSSFDDHGLIWDSVRERVVFSSNRYTKPGHRDHLYIGPDYLLFPHPDAPIDSTELLAELAAKRLADSLMAAALADSLRIADSIAAALFAADSLRIADSLMALQDSLRIADSLMAAAMADSLRIADSLMALQPDTLTMDTLMATMPPPPDTAQAVDTSQPFKSFFGMDVVKTTEKQDLSKYINDSMSAKQIIDSISKHRKDVARVDARYVNDYQKRMADPLRRTKLQVVPPGAKCEVCEDKTRQRPADQPFFVRTNDDKALILLTDQAGKVSYIDVAPNAAYQIEVTTMGSNGQPSLPKSVEMSDLRRTVVTRDYVLFECVPKLAELGDEVYINNLYFDFDGDSLVRDATRELDRMIIIALKNPNMIFEIEAHADERGSEAYNVGLTDRRLASTVAYVEKKGFDTDRLVPKSYGKSRPLIKNARNEEEHRLNRRVTFRLFNPQAKNQLTGTDYPLAEQEPAYSDQVYFKLQLGAFRRPLENPLEYYQDVFKVDPSFKLTYYMDKDGLYKYNVGDTYSDIEVVRALVRRLLDNNRECYIAAFYQGHRITVAEAMAVLRRQKGL